MESLLIALGITQPGTQAAAIQGVLSLLGIFATGLVAIGTWVANQRADRGRQRGAREEKIRDFRIALHAEVRAELKNLAEYDLAAHLAEIEKRYQSEKGYSVWVPPLAKHVLFDAIVSEIHVLPEDVIDAVVLYARQRQAVISVIREQSYAVLGADRQVAIYRDYLKLWAALRELAARAEAALSGQGFVSNPASSPSNQ